MTNEISITISKILNWTLTNCNTRLEVAFYAQATRNYLAHKTTMGYFSSQFLVVNTSFKIHFNPQEHIVNVNECRSFAGYQKSKTIII